MLHEQITESSRNTKTIIVAALGLIVLASLLSPLTGAFPLQAALALAGVASAGLLWQALATQRDVGQASRQARKMQLVFAASESILSSLDVAQVLHRAAEAAARLSWHAGAALLYLADEGGQWELKSSFGIDDTSSTQSRLAILDSYLAEVQKTQRFTVTALPARSGSALERFQSACVLPLEHKGGMMGELVLLSPKHPAAFSQELSILEYFAGQAAMAIDNARLYGRVQDLFLSTIKALAAAVDAKDAYTHGHSEDIATLVGMVAREMKLPQREEEHVKLAGLLHDVGKIGIPDAILRKPGRLDASERAIMMSHAALGAEIIDKPGPLQSLVAIVRHHHERHDGTGYPAGLKGNEIPIGAAILAVADAFDAMTSHRAYHAARPIPDGLEELARNAGTQFNPDVVEALTRVIDREQRTRSEWYAALERRIHDRRDEQAPARADAAEENTEAGVALKLAQELRHVSDLRTLLDRLVTLTPDALGADECAVLLVDDREQELTVEALREGTRHSAGPATTLRRGQRIARGRSIAWLAIEQTAAQLEADAQAVYAPLIVGGRAIGVLRVGGQQLGPEHMRPLSIIADAVAPMLHATRLQERALTDAGRDPLTGLLNRAALLARLDEEASRFQRHRTPYGMAMGAVRDLPQFNAAYGFGAGDELIKRVAAVLADNTRTSDVIGRISGGTFAILMPEADEAAAMRGVRRLEELFAERQVPIRGKFVQCPPLSWTIVSCPHDAKEPDALFALAERRLLESENG